jgi:peptide/nickel transport system substrate-binding protein
LTTPDFTFLSILTSNSLAIGEAKVIQAHGGTDASDASKVDTAEAWLDDHSVGSGPYVLQSWTRGVQLVMVRNNKYWLPEPAVPEIVFKFVDSASSEQLLVQKGGAAIAIDLSPDQIASLASDTSIGVASVSALEVVYMGWAASGPVAGPLNNPENWDAIKDAINYAQLVELSRGAATQASSLLPKVMEGGLPSSDALKENLTKAKQALTAAGNPNGFAFTLTYATDETAAGLPTSLLAEAIAGDLAIIHSWADDYPGTSDFLPVFIPGGVVATTRQDWPKTASDQQITNLSNEGFATGNAQARASLFSQALELLNQDGPYVPLLDTQAQYAYNKTEVSNVIGNSLWFIDLDQLTTP